MNPPDTDVTDTPGLVLVIVGPPSILMARVLIFTPDPFVSSRSWNEIDRVLDLFDNLSAGGIHRSLYQLLSSFTSFGQNKKAPYLGAYVFSETIDIFELRLAVASISFPISF